MKVQTGWPTTCPQVPPSDEGWFDEENISFLSCYLGPGMTVVEVGAWMGRSTRWIADKTVTGTVYTIDHFEGSAEHRAEPKIADKLPGLWDTFVASCWEHRERIVPIRARSIAGLVHLYSIDVTPDLVYVDGSHLYADVMRDLAVVLTLWPNTRVVGDDFRLPDVARAAFDVANMLGLQICGNRRCFTFEK